MKTFDKSERKLIKTIAEDKKMGGNVISLLDDYLDKTCIIINIKERNGLLNQHIANQNNMLNNLNLINNKIGHILINKTKMSEAIK